MSSLPEARENLAETAAASTRLSMEDFSQGPNKIHDLEKETWLDGVIAAKLKAECDEALPMRASIAADLKKIKNQACLSDTSACHFFGSSGNLSVSYIYYIY